MLTKLTLGISAALAISNLSSLCCLAQADSSNGGVAGVRPGSVTSSAPVSNGKFILAAPPGALANAGSFPANMLLVDDGRYAIVTDTGFRESLTSIDTATGAVAGAADFNYKPPRAPKVNPSELPQAGVNGTPGVQKKAEGLYYGLASVGETVYAAQGSEGRIAVLRVGADGSLTRGGTIEARAGDFVAGLAADARGYLYAVNNEYYDAEDEDDPRDLTTPGSLSIYKLSAGGGSEAARIALGSLRVPTADAKLGALRPDSYPLAAAAIASGAKCYVTSERDGVVYSIDTRDPAAPKLLRTIKTGSHPAYLLLDKAEQHLYVANADADTVSVIDTATDAVTRIVSLRPAAARGLPGASPMGMALSPSGQTLYVALGDINAVGVADAKSGRVRGYLPAGWYPTSVAATPSGRLLVASAKGSAARIPNDVEVLPSGAQRHYVLNIIEGTVQTRPLPTAADLKRGTAQVMANNRYAALSASAAGVAMLRRVGRGAGKITHVVYIIKENRTYDQVLGDLPEGNGDASLAMFGKNITPNQHALARRFVLLDNFFDSGDVSGDGWTWSTQSYADENVARDIPYNYSGRGRNYDVEGQNNGYITGGFPALGPDGERLSRAFPHGAPAIPDVSQGPGGYIWDDARRAGLTLRNFGFFLSDGVTGVLPDNYPTKPGLQPAGHGVQGVTDVDFRKFDLDYPDSDAPGYYAAHGDLNASFKTTGYGKFGSPDRYAEWRRVFDEMIARDPSGRSVPNLMTVRFMTDHTSGMRGGAHSPASDVADNDYAVGELVEHISRSPIWAHTAIFVIEDDAQNGQDHVDAHRSTCYVISPYIKRASVDHTFYNTDSVLHTMEGLLGLRPMSQYDGVATPILDFAATPANGAPFEAIRPAESIIAERNPSRDALGRADPRRALVIASDKMNWQLPDSQPTDLLNAINWKSVHGARSEPPAPRHTVIAAGQAATTVSALTGKPEREDEDDSPQDSMNGARFSHSLKSAAHGAHGGDHDDDGE